MIDGPYEEIDAGFEYLNLSGRRLGREGVLEIFADVAFDSTLKQLDVGYNISAEEFADRRNIESFLRAIRKMLLRNKTLTALELAGNNLFQYHPHPANEHTKSYEAELVKLLKDSRITHLDLSDNNIAGHSGRELNGLNHIMKDYLRPFGKALKCRLSKLNSQGLCAISNCLGRDSSMTFLDISHNVGGLDPSGRANSEGVAALSLQLSQSLQLRVLKLSNNRLGDDDVVLLAAALQHMPQFQDLDISGNCCRTNGMRALKDAIVSHSMFDSGSQGFRHVDVSNNPFGDGGARELGIAVSRSFTLQSLLLRCCCISDGGMNSLREGLAMNCSLLLLETHGNYCSSAAEGKTQAEVEAARNVSSLRVDAMSIDASTLPQYAYCALAKKLQFMTPQQLAALHSNSSFTKPDTEMQESLFLLQPPPRKALIKEVRDRDDKMNQRLQQSAALDAKLAAADVIFRNVLLWFEPFRVENNLRRALLRAREKAQKRNAHNDEDDLYSP